MPLKMYLKKSQLSVPEITSALEEAERNWQPVSFVRNACILGSKQAMISLST